jgi:ion channel-forming bestrophin family protein
VGSPKAWGGIVNTSRSWGIMVKDYVSNKHAANKLSNEALKQIQLTFLKRHFAWLTALRFQLREARAWEGIYKEHNQEYRDKWYKVEEHNTKLEQALLNYLSEEEIKHLMTKTNKAAYLISQQSSHLRELLEKGYIEDFRHMEMERVLVEFLNQQGVSERIKNFPYPRQYATINLYFTRIFSILVPLGMLQEFSKLGGYFIWFSIPFSVLSMWIFTTMEKIGEASESPFEGSANDVPITTMSRAIEIDLLEMFDEKDIPPPLKPQNNIVV